MRLAYANARFRPDAHDGANAHVRQFVQNTVALGDFGHQSVIGGGDGSGGGRHAHRRDPSQAPEA